MKKVGELDLMLSEYIDKKQSLMLEKKIEELEIKRAIRKERQEKSIHE